MAATPRKAAWNFLEGLVGSGMPKNLIQKTLREAGMGYRRAVMFADIDYFKGLTISKKALKSMPKFLTPESWMTQTTPQHLSRKYLYRFEVTGTNIATGGRETVTRSLYRDDLLSITELEDEMRAAMIGQGETSDYDVEKVEILSVTDRDKEPF